jgi:hypothetical protein
MSVFKLLICNLHWHEFVRIPTNEKLCSILIQDLETSNICCASRLMVQDNVLCLFHRCTRHLMSLMLTCHYHNDMNFGFTCILLLFHHHSLQF